ncbi:MAG: asparaginase [Oscillospiraceae bacterium]|nr:asparaginase [Oscillospiraceae bacterium]
MLIAQEIRGAIVDLQHHGHAAVCDAAGRLLWQHGDAHRVTFARSSTKPMQALVVQQTGALHRFGITQQKLAVICASHGGETMHTQAVAAILAKAGLNETCLQCGTHKPFSTNATYEKLTPLHNNCSGKHAGMLLAALAMDEPLHSYLDPAHPHQQRITRLIAELCGLPVEQIVMGLDGCGAPVHALPLANFAQGYARLPAAAPDIVQAMVAQPDMLCRPGSFTTELQRRFGDRLVCKVGASAYFAIALLDGSMGIALKIESGCMAVLPPVVLAILLQLGVITQAEAESLPQFYRPVLRNHKGEMVGYAQAMLS